MAKVILLCGKICSGKSTYADRIRREKGAVILSVDEIMLAVFGQDAGEKHDEYAVSLKEYLFAKSTELVAAGIDVVMDIGLWTKAERARARNYYQSRKITSEIHYMDVSDAEWKHRIEQRNRDVSANKIRAYYIDEGLFQKTGSLFEKPDETEVDVWVNG